MSRLENERLKTKTLVISFKCSRTPEMCGSAMPKMTGGSRGGRSTMWISSIPQAQTKSSSRAAQDSSRPGRRGTMGYWGSCFPNFTNRTPDAQAGEARELCPPHPIEGYEIEEIVRPAAAVANAKIRFRTSGRSWAAAIRLSRLEGTAPAADREPGG